MTRVQCHLLALPQARCDFDKGVRVLADGRFPALDNAASTDDITVMLALPFSDGRQRHDQGVLNTIHLQLHLGSHAWLQADIGKVFDLDDYGVFLHAAAEP